MNQNLTLLHTQLLSLLTHLPFSSPPNERHPTILYLHGQTQLTKLLDHAHRMRLDLFLRQQDTFRRYGTCTRVILHSQFREIFLDVLRILVRAQYANRSRQHFGQPMQIVRVFVLRRPAHRDLQEFILAKEYPPLGAAIVVVVVHSIAATIFATSTEMKAHVLEMVGAHIFVGKEVDAIVGVDGAPNHIHIVGFVLARFFGCLG
mmetsp:Transcript_15180/g.36444  ORF Transcript_15180/g.36444 Transcript_15180/m.36444 type:complete len:204 (-) Transcript_15180:157-768(-)